LPRTARVQNAHPLRRWRVQNAHPLRRWRVQIVHPLRRGRVQIAHPLRRWRVQIVHPLRRGRVQILHPLPGQEDAGPVCRGPSADVGEVGVGNGRAQSAAAGVQHLSLLRGSRVDFP
jgi:hypothetical protein